MQGHKWLKPFIDSCIHTHTHTPHDSLDYWISPNQESGTSFLEYNLDSDRWCWSPSCYTACKSGLTCIPYPVWLFWEGPREYRKVINAQFWSLVFDNSNDSFSHFQALFGLWGLKQQTVNVTIHSLRSSTEARTAVNPFIFLPRPCHLNLVLRNRCSRRACSLSGWVWYGEKKHLGTFSGRGNKGNAQRGKCVRGFFWLSSSPFLKLEKASTGVCSVFAVQKWKNDSRDSSCKLCNMIKAGR